MRFAGKELTQQEAQQVLDDAKQGRIVDRYKLNQGGEHPIFTKALHKENCKTQKERGLHERPYNEWVWMRVQYLSRTHDVHQVRKES